MSGFHKLTIKEINHETADCVTLNFSIPSELKSAFQFTSGQYLTLKKSINGEELRRDYSICSSPNSEDLKVAIKTVENGKFSTYANTQLNVNDTIEVSLPNGRFIFNPMPNAKRIITAFAAGSGITPILSIAKSLLESESESEFILVYGNKSIKDTMFFNQLIELEKKYPNRFHLTFLFSRTQEKNALFGRIERSTVNLILKNKFKDLTIDAFYICGPIEMTTTIKDVLLENDIDEKRIKFELFTPAKPDTIATEVTKETIDGSSEITIIVDDEESTFTMSQQKNILDAALKENLDAPYSCQGGICSSCIARVTEGSATMKLNNILTDSEISEGLILTCQAYPTSNTLTVNYDEV